MLFLKWQKDSHKLERDGYLSLATLLSGTCLYAIAYYTDKLERYRRFKDEESKSQ
jgi:hypothetical protein